MAIPQWWIRTCQECGHKQAATPPATGKPLTTAYTEAKCRKCHSIGLDYGTFPSTAQEDES